MIKNYVTTALRALLRNKTFSLINVLGLAVGISAAVVIYLVVHYDTSFEQFQKDKDRIFRVVTQGSFANRPFPSPGVPYPLISAAKKEISGVEESAAVLPFVIHKVFFPGRSDVARRFEKNSDVICVDDHYFRMFPYYRWLAGAPASLSEPGKVVLTESRAREYFPGLALADIPGKTLTYDDSITCAVTGIVADVQEHTDLVFKEFISLSTAKFHLATLAANSSWNNFTYPIELYIRLKPGVFPTQVQRQLDLLHRQHPATGKDSMWSALNYLQPLTDMHYADSGYYLYHQRRVSRLTLYGLMTVSLFLLLLGCINFINLTTACGAQRAKEIGIRKTLGGSRRQLAIQFLGEAFLLTLSAALLALAMTPLLIRLFAGFLPPELPGEPLIRPDLLAFWAILVLLVSLLSGIYPALILSRLPPVRVLKNQANTVSSSSRSSLLRQVLTTFQFVIAQAFIIVALIVGKQIHYFLHMDMGFKKDAIVYCKLPAKRDAKEANARCALLKDRLRHMPGITALSVAAAPPVAGWGVSFFLTYTDGKKKIGTDLWWINADTAYMRLFDIHLLAGRNFSAGEVGEEELVINRAYAQILGFTHPEEALGKIVSNGPNYRIVGVMEDFHHGSLREPIKAIAIHHLHDDNSGACINIRLPDEAHGGWQASLAQIAKDYKEIYQGEDFDYQFLDDTIAQLYATEQQMSTLVRWATGLTIFISCLGLLGLVIYSTNLRRKEISIRKVLGATVIQILALLSKNFVKLVVIAFVIAIPIAWYTTHQWLESFAYRAPLSWGVFALSGLAMLAIALLTLGTQTIRAANGNPVKSLRTE